MKKSFWLPVTIAAVMLATACTDKDKKTPTAASEEPASLIDSAMLELFDWELADLPMFIMSTEGVSMHVWEGSADSMLYTPNAASYTTLLYDGTPIGIRYVAPQMGKAGMGNAVLNLYANEMCGLRYESKVGDNLPWGFAFTDKFLEAHDNYVFVDQEYDRKAPKEVLNEMKARYDGKVRDSWVCAESKDKSLAIYTVQYEPVDTFCMAMIAVRDHDSIYVFEDPTTWYDEYAGWHVDDNGEYGPLGVYAIMRGAKGLSIFCISPAAESVNPCILMVRDGKLVKYHINCYYNYVDFVPPIDPCPLPATAKLQAECDGFKIYVDEEVAPSEEDPCGRHTVYYSKPDEEGTYYFLATDSLSAESSKMLLEESWPTYVRNDQLLSASEAQLIKNPAGEVYAVIQGCPDARNIFSYMISLPLYEPDYELTWIPTNAGFLGLDDSGELIKAANYGYNDDGRFTITRYYNFFMSLQREEFDEEE